MTEYDRIALAYSQRLRRIAHPSRLYFYTPSLFAHLPDLTGKRVLDLGCGDGYFTEMLKEHGASLVVGVDASAAQIRLAEAHAAAKQLDIRYLVAPVEDLPSWTFDRFDVVTAVFLLHYAKTKSALEAMCHTIANAVQYSGMFVAITLNPDHPESRDPRYHHTAQFQSGQYEGAPLIVTLDVQEGRPPISFVNYYWSRQSYEDAMTAAGMAKPMWHPLIVSEAGRHALPAAYWEGWLANINQVVMVARHGLYRTTSC